MSTLRIRKLSLGSINHSSPVIHPKTPHAFSGQNARSYWQRWSQNNVLHIDKMDLKQKL
jgi:hypothetical protein